MTKLMLCEDCFSLVVPDGENLKARWCRCGRHAVWWLDGPKGILRIYDKHKPPEKVYPDVPRVYIIGITNLLLMFPGSPTKEEYREIIESHSDNYMFKRRETCIVKLRPGETGDTSYDELPK